jgi:hypothetical protein
MRLAEDAAIMGRKDSYCFHVNAAVRYLQATPSKRFGLGKLLARTEKKYADDCVSQEEVRAQILMNDTTINPLSTSKPVIGNILSVPQLNAQKSAKQYLTMKGFSRDSLIFQLSSNFGSGYSVSDATIAVDSLSINWNEQAVRSAQGYLLMMGFSCNGLIQQLSSDFGDKYTVTQAAFGARQAGAC